MLPIQPLLHLSDWRVPLASILAIVVAASPDRRARLGWLTWILASAAGASALVARQSGLTLEQALYPDVVPRLVTDHKALGEDTIWFVLALWLAVTALLLIDLDYRRRSGVSSPVLPTLLAVVTILTAMGASWEVLLTGWAGSESRWTGVVDSEGR